MSNIVDMITQYKKAIGGRCKIQREKLGLTQQQVIDRSQISRASYLNLEKGTANITLEHLLKVAHTLKLNPGELMPDWRDIKPDYGIRETPTNWHAAFSDFSADLAAGFQVVRNSLYTTFTAAIAEFADMEMEEVLKAFAPAMEKKRTRERQLYFLRLKYQANPQKNIYLYTAARLAEKYGYDITQEESLQWINQASPDMMKALGELSTNKGRLTGAAFKKALNVTGRDYAKVQEELKVLMAYDQLPFSIPRGKTNEVLQHAADNIDMDLKIFKQYRREFTRLFNDHRVAVYRKALAKHQ